MMRPHVIAAMELAKIEKQREKLLNLTEERSKTDSPVKHDPESRDHPGA